MYISFTEEKKGSCFTVANLKLKNNFQMKNNIKN